VQRGRGADTGAAFGSGASSTVFGARGSASFLSRSTSILAILFFSNCFVLSYFAGKTTQPKSVMEQAAGSGTALEEALKKAVDDATKKAQTSQPASNSEVPSAPSAGGSSEVPTAPSTNAGSEAPVAPATPASSSEVPSAPTTSATEVPAVNADAPPAATAPPASPAPTAPAN
jgi:preprotein translocase subunit SecG